MNYLWVGPCVYFCIIHLKRSFFIAVSDGYPGLAAIWKEERQRREALNIGDPLSPPPSPGKYRVTIIIILVLASLHDYGMLNYNTVNRKYFVVLDSLAYAKIKHAKMCTIKGNAVQGRLSANYVYLT